MGQDLFTRIEDVTYEQLVSLIDKAVQRDRNDLMSAVTNLRKIEYKNRETAAKLLNLTKD
jgi:hypothetical protein